MDEKLKYRDALIDEIEKRIKTIFIGAISTIEDEKDRLNISEEDFQKIRKKILDIGNRNMRSLVYTVVRKYVVYPRKFKIRFDVVQDQEKE